MSNKYPRFGIYLEKQDGGETSDLVLTLLPEAQPRKPLTQETRRLEQAARWAMQLDAQMCDLLKRGRALRIQVPHVIGHSVRRARREAKLAYQELRRGVGELIRPIVLEKPKLSNLFQFQRQGVKWLSDRNSAILADDMGLGKTVQVIATMRLLFNNALIRSSLVICPKGLIPTWEREFLKWAPELAVSVLTPPARIRESAWRVVRPRCHVMLTNYEQMRNAPSVLLEDTPDLVVADEAHRLRKHSAKITAGSFKLRPSRFWALTGTPIERDTEDLATLLSLVARSRFSPADAKLHPSSLRGRAREYILRRRKQEVLDQLPTVLDTTQVVELSFGQRRAYRAAVDKFRCERKKSEELALLTRLQAICDIDVSSKSSSKCDRIIELLSCIRERDEKAVVFSLRLEPLRVLHHRICKMWGKQACSLLLGEMDYENRSQALEHFRSNAQALALLASTRVGGEGLTLVEANHVFLFNQWWNPATNEQARDRVVRIGQRKKVRVYRFCCRGTVEELIEEIITKKKILFDTTVERLAGTHKTLSQELLAEIGIENLLSA